MNRREEKDDDESKNYLQNLDKSALIQEARYFNSTPVNPRKCILILSKIIYLINQGEQLTNQEATDLFFATTKLFQSKDVVLRRLVYLCIKELSSMAQDVIIVTSSLTKDMTGQEDLYRAAAIRALCSITDSTMLQAIERYMKQAIVDKNPAVSSAALVSALHLSATVPDLVRRWVNESQEAITSDQVMVSYHALAVVAAARKNDRLSTAKLVMKLTRAPLRSPFTLSYLIRLAAKVVDEDPDAVMPLDFLETCLRHKSEIVVYEAAHALLNLKKPTKSLAHAVSVLQIFCGSSKATLRLAGVRTLAKLAIKHPNLVANCAADLENLITDSNRSVATLAVTTLLATGAESSIDRLMKQISGFMSEIPDEFKTVVVNAISCLCTKYPRKYHSLASFLAGMLRDEGGLQYKTAIAEALIDLVENNPEAKETGLAHLCEFIEDCEHTSLAVRILYILGREGPKAPQPSRYIRYIYNRVILETGPVRAAAVAAVARFGASRQELLPNVRVLLSRCQLDDDDEVRDRAIYYSAILDSGDKQLINDYILNISMPNPILLERALKDYLVSENAINEPFNVDIVPVEEEVQDVKESSVEIETRKVAVVSLQEKYADDLKIVPGIEKLGPLFKTCVAVDLTEPETEYRVSCVKHIFAKHLILQFECLNTLSDQLLEKVHIRLEMIPGYIMLNEVPCEKLPYDKQGSIFCVLEFPKNPIESLGSFGAILEFVVRDCDATTGLPDDGEGYADTYPLEEIEIGCAEQFRTSPATDDWEGSWDRASSVAEANDTFGMAQTDAGEAALAVCEHLGLSMAAITGDAVKEIRGGSIWREGAPVLIRARLVAAQGAVTMQLVARSVREDIATFLLTAVG
ncbi:coatomer subunit gamma-like [Plodia interpunctella]|uniref:coatomer subunit gamma-like n=1 Tax=Plodia interpunctella TaxID=58824 RepID=UPI002368C113|nr:coatomer subunit gamma-like [Plodia interpunctella]